jgi:hypothetical protein
MTHEVGAHHTTEDGVETVAVPLSILSQLLNIFKNFPSIIADIEKLLGDV